MSLQNKVALVTGASSGIGAAIALKLTEEGAQVVIVGRNEVKLMHTSDNCEARGLKPLIILADITVDDDLENIIAKTLSSFGKLNILVNNAGFFDKFSILDKGFMSQFDKVMYTNYRSAVYLTHLAAEHLSATKGNIVNIGGVVALKVISNETSANTSSKAGLNHFTKCIAKDFAAKGVRVNIVCPGPVAGTELFTKILTDKPATKSDWNVMAGKQPLIKVSKTEEIADLVAYISSDKGRSFTGSSIVIDNGTLVEFYLKSSDK